MGLKWGAIGSLGKLLWTWWEPNGNLKGTCWEQTNLNPPPPKKPKTEGGHHSDKNQTTRKGWEPYPSPSDKAPLIFNGWVWASTVEDFFRFRRSSPSSCAWQWLSNHATKIKACIYDFLQFFMSLWRTPYFV
jgi:hypothetical protein